MCSVMIRVFQLVLLCQLANAGRVGATCNYFSDIRLWQSYQTADLPSPGSPVGVYIFLRIIWLDADPAVFFLEAGYVLIQRFQDGLRMLGTDDNSHIHKCLLPFGLELPEIQHEFIGRMSDPDYVGIYRPNPALLASLLACLFQVLSLVEILNIGDDVSYWNISIPATVFR